MLNYILYNVDCQGIRLQQVKHRRHHAHLIQENCTCRHRLLRWNQYVHGHQVH